VLGHILQAAAGLGSFADAAFALNLAGIPISARHVGRLAHAIGAEMVHQRDAKAVRRRQRQLPARVASAPTVVAVEVDGGRLRTREAGSGPGVHQPQHKEDKIACLVTLQSDRHEQDPQPEPSALFCEPRRVQRLVRQMKGLPSEHPSEPQESSVPCSAPKAAPVREAPQRLVRTCVASMYNSRRFGPLVAAEAQERAFYQAPRRAFVGDGQAYNWSIHEGYFADFEPIVDLLHVLCYVYLAAWAVGGNDEQRWSRYLAWMRACWQGRVGEVLAELVACQQQLGQPPPGEELKEFDPRRLMAEAVSYLGNNQQRMDYPRYRREGLPTTSSLVESLVGEFNARVKGAQKFWNRLPVGGAETILQLRAALLSEDDRLARHLSERPGSPYRRKAA
jgi:hypothetical protein